MDGNAYLTLKEASQTLSVHEQTIRNWGRRGLIRLVRLPGSGHRRVPGEEVRRLLTQMLQRESAVTTVRLEPPSGDAELAARGRSLAAEIQQQLDTAALAATLEELMESLRGRPWSS